MCDARRPIEGADSAAIEHGDRHGVGGELRTGSLVPHETPVAMNSPEQRRLRAEEEDRL